MRLGACGDDAAEMHCESRRRVLAPFAVRRVQTAKEVSVALVGEVDAAKSTAVWAAMAQAMALGAQLTLDLGGTTFNDATGIDPDSFGGAISGGGLLTFSERKTEHGDDARTREPRGEVLIFVTAVGAGGKGRRSRLVRGVPRRVARLELSGRLRLRVRVPECRSQLPALRRCLVHHRRLQPCDRQHLSSRWCSLPPRDARWPMASGWSHHEVLEGCAQQRSTVMRSFEFLRKHLIPEFGD